MIKVFTLLLGFALSLAAPAVAHQDFRVVGEVTQTKAGLVIVKMRDGNIATVQVDRQTTITKDNVKIDAKQIKAGQFVLIDATGHGFDDLLALEILLVPPIPPEK